MLVYIVLYSLLHNICKMFVFQQLMEFKEQIYSPTQRLSDEVQLCPPFSEGVLASTEPNNVPNITDITHSAITQ